MRSSLQLLALIALSARVLAVPPACLLNAVNEQDEPSDLSAICGREAETVQQAIVDMCGDNEEVAQSAFIATCSAAGSSVGTFNIFHWPSHLSTSLLRRPSFPRGAWGTIPATCILSSAPISLLNETNTPLHSRLHPHNHTQLSPHRLRLQPRRHIRLHNRCLQQ
jgi:hypothetical protein